MNIISIVGWIRRYHYYWDLTHSHLSNTLSNKFLIFTMIDIDYVSVSLAASILRRIIFYTNYILLFLNSWKSMKWFSVNKTQFPSRMSMTVETIFSKITLEREEEQEDCKHRTVMEDNRGHDCFTLQAL